MNDHLSVTHTEIIALQTEMKQDIHFESLCKEHGLPWDFAGGYEPRGYNGPAPERVRLLVLLAEPGAITPTEARNPLTAIGHNRWIEPFDTRLQEHYWRINLRELCRHVWPENTDENMYACLGKSNTFWMSLPPAAQTREVPRAPLQYFLWTYLKRFVALFPNAIILAAGGKAQRRLKLINADFECCSAFTRPESNKPHARDSYRRAAEAIKAKLALRGGCPDVDTRTPLD
jgi:hypothetical protein